ncbi:PIG-L family deacetylase [Mesonia sp. K7]|uniref:PIG-L family deacetylase n=1 Tax=Mesonia sp. K7 TaxID=2218606 RepID=UPI000DA8BC2A|nr:PIG-L family deacetylase [Mesonia sp. K7]PZD79357.1 LmbE family protein [Mesonia sp. K7]
MFFIKKHFYFFFLLTSLVGFSQQTIDYSSAAIYQKIEQLEFLGSVLYLAAHPDDENTKLISYYANHKHAKTAYLSITRGDGGQNLIGTQLREQLGLIRTQELLAARKIDGGQQFFTRANDFGFSKTPQETLEIWNKEKVLADVVMTIRKFKPDVIINRFDHRSEGNTHGHHTASARLSVEAFRLANDSNFHPESAQKYGLHQPKRLFWNTSWWFYGSQEAFNKTDKSNLVEVNVGVFDPMTGKSNTEIAALSRSQHKSQGFGNTAIRGNESEYLELLEGEKIKNNDVFENINTRWSKIEGGDKIEKLVTDVKQDFDFLNPQKSVTDLVKIYTEISQLKSNSYKTEKLELTQEIIFACLGLYTEISTPQQHLTRGSKITLNIENTLRNNQEVRLKNIEIPSLGFYLNKNILLSKNQNNIESFSVEIPQKVNYTSPYWLNPEASLGMYQVENENLIGLPENLSEIIATITYEINGETFQIKRPLIHKHNDPVRGEVNEPILIVPDVVISFENPMMIFADNQPKSVAVKVKSYQDNLSGSLQFKTEKGWEINSVKQELHFNHKGEEQTIMVTIKPTQKASEISAKAFFVSDHGIFDQSLTEIDFDHIPKQMILSPAESKLIRLDLQKRGNLIGYIEGAGDLIPQSLHNIGYQVDNINLNESSLSDLLKYYAIVVGIRAFNTNEDLVLHRNLLFNYAKNGGTVVTQYNTTRGLQTQEIAPFPIALSRERVTDEFSEVKFLNRNHSVLNFPNKITKEDFTGWVQERGLYFPNEWDKNFTPVLSFYEHNEGWKDGSLLIGKHGKGYYIYTGISFFRELPEGVSGAYKLFVNLLSIGKK